MNGFVLRAPWYVRERDQLTLLDPAALRPAIQMYDDTNFVRRITADPRDSLKFDPFDDVWSYPVPVKPVGNGRLRLSPWQLVPTQLRKLYQPSHNRFYAVVAEVFCDRPGLPRAGSHEEVEVSFVVRRRRGLKPGPKNRDAVRDLMRDLAREYDVPLDETGPVSRDLRDLWWGDRAWRERHREDLEHADLDVDDGELGWFTDTAGGNGHWRAITEELPNDLEEQNFPMWRLPAREDDCAAARTRSTWFGVVPTFSGEHDNVRGRPRPKYDSHAIYELRCVVRERPRRGKEKCPPREWWSERASEPFRLADPMDPMGTSKRLTSITLPDLRRLAARAGRPMGPGGVIVTTPPNSAMVFNPLKVGPDARGALGAGGAVCTFALELFFLVAFFLFLAFLPIVVLIFQLWFLLALRFCIPPSIGLDVAATFLADATVDFSGGVTAKVRADAGLATKVDGLTPTPGSPTVDEVFDQIFGTDSTLLDVGANWLDQVKTAKDLVTGQPIFEDDPDVLHGAVLASDPRLAVPATPPETEQPVDDPLCP